MQKPIEKSSNQSSLPEQFAVGHELCFLNHDFLVELLRSAESQRVFTKTLDFRSEADREAFENSEDLFEWLEATQRETERTEILRLIVFPALLSDFLHFIYEALASSRKAKLNVAYALLRKPIQEHLYLFEMIASDLSGFSDRLVNDPTLLRAQKAGGVDAHACRINSVLNALKATDRFDARFLAQLRYDKNADDGFDGLCNTAIHLFTAHEAIRTEKLNINFVFSGWEDKLTQWSFLYSRLPYLLSYAHLLVEHVFGSFQNSDIAYLEYTQRRLAATSLLWGETIRPPYQHCALDKFIDSVRQDLNQMCLKENRRSPTRIDLERMRSDGSWPGESRLSIIVRDARFHTMAQLSRFLARNKGGDRG